MMFGQWEFEVILIAISLAIWIYLIGFHGRFWQADQRLPRAVQQEKSWPSVVAVIPARNESENIFEAVTSILSQEYRGTLKLILVDDQSDDGTADIARDAAAKLGALDRLMVVSGQPLPEGWVGKMWAVHQGLRTIPTYMDDAEFVVLTDADIEHAPSAVRSSVAFAKAHRLVLVSLMVRLRMRQFWEGLMWPAFVFFFQKLYPFPWVNDPNKTTAAAAGGFMLVRRSALDKIDGVERIKDRLIDDCALAAELKDVGAIWLGLAEHSRSLRVSTGLDDIWLTITRTAYTQLQYQPMQLLGTILGMVMVYLVPVYGLLVRDIGSLSWDIALASYLLMVVAVRPTHKLYIRPWWEGLLLPFIASLFLAMTVDSARRHYLGKGGGWKGRVYDVTKKVKEPEMAGASNPELASSSQSVETPSGKGASDENFPVGSFLVKAEHRPHVFAFYGFARAADDISDNANLAGEDKVRRLKIMAQVLDGEMAEEWSPSAHKARISLHKSGISAQHCHDLLVAFSRDAVKNRTQDWDDLMDYCRYSAAPVGRYVLDLHGETPEVTWGPNDALCAALQVINHLQDVKKDFLQMDRVYVPMVWLEEKGLTVDDLAKDAVSPALRSIFDHMLDETEKLMVHARLLPKSVRSRRLAMETGAIVEIADQLIAELRTKDPLAVRIELDKAAFLAYAAKGAFKALITKN